MKKALLLLLALGACALDTQPELGAPVAAEDEDAGVGVQTEALSAAMTWPTLDKRGYDTLNALKCYVGEDSTCQYGVDYYGRQCTGGWACAKCKASGSWGFTYTARVDPYTGRGVIWVENKTIVSNVALGPLLAGDLRTFTYDGNKKCWVKHSWIWYAETDLR
jgi:hypothetical protein